MKTRILHFGSLALAVLAIVFAAWFGYAWWSASHDEGIGRAVVRDDALKAGQRAVAALTTLDYRQADQGYQRWLDVSTGALHDELTQDKQASLDRIVQAKTVTDAKVLDAAVTEVDSGAGTAKVIASVELQVKPDGADAVTKRNRFQAELARTPAGWRVTALGQIPVTQS
jgi:Mce-associated membrane protein